MNHQTPVSDDGPLQPNMVFYQVLVPSPIRAPNGDIQYATVGPFTDLGTASQHAAKTVGALIMLCTILFKTPPHALTPIKK